jgi:hypothetical protein
MFCRLPWVPDAEHEALPVVRTLALIVAVGWGTCTSLCTSNAVAQVDNASYRALHWRFAMKTLHRLSYSKVTLG